MKIGNVEFEIITTPFAGLYQCKAYMNGNMVPVSERTKLTRKSAYDSVRRELLRDHSPSRVMKWCRDNLEVDEDGNFIAYKKIGNNRTYLTDFKYPKSWKIKQNSILIENKLERSPYVNCGSGVNVATESWCLNAYIYVPLWKVKIFKSDIVKGDVIVPIQTDGKFRCRRIKLIEQL